MLHEDHFDYDNRFLKGGRIGAVLRPGSETRIPTYVSREEGVARPPSRVVRPEARRREWTHVTRAFRVRKVHQHRREKYKEISRSDKYRSRCYRCKHSKWLTSFVLTQVLGLIYGRKTHSPYVRYVNNGFFNFFFKMGTLDFDNA